MATVAEQFSLAFQHHKAGNLKQAEALYRQVLHADPNHADANHLLGALAFQTGRFDLAVASMRKALTLNPLAPTFHCNLGLVLSAKGLHKEAEAEFRQALALFPDYAEARYNLAIVLSDCGRLEEAVQQYQQALRIRPTYAEAHNNLGNTLKEFRRLDEALAHCREAVRLAPTAALAHNSLGAVLREQGKYDEAEAHCREALRLQPDLPAAHNNLGVALQEQGKLDEAVAQYEQAKQLQPDNYLPVFNIGNVLLLASRVDEAIACYKQALLLKPEMFQVHDSLLLAMQYRAGITLRELAEAHAEFEQRHTAPLRTAWKPHANNRDSERRLRLGFLSPDLNCHAVGYFLIRCLENLDRDQAFVICYNNSQLNDHITERIHAASNHWHDVFAWSDERLTEQIRADGVDILFDLAGHTANNRLLVFARKPAPIQMTWAGYVGTTGLKAIDYIVADRFEIPPGVEAYYSEHVLRLPEGYVCYDPPEVAPAVSPLPALAKGYVTFGSFNNPKKLGSQVVEVWARVLRQVPRARLVLKFKEMNHPYVGGYLAKQFVAHGISADRVDFLGGSSHADLLRLYHNIDIALDPFPYGGGLTTCEALWMGVPVITCPGETFASRHALSHLSNVGLTETIAGNLDGYVKLAVSLAADLERLAAIRASLRKRMADSPLCDGKRFAENFMILLRGAWREWCRQPSGS